MNVLRRWLLLATKYDLEIEARWIATGDNALADALSHFDYNRIANLAPQVTYPAFNHQNHGFLTYTNRDYHEDHASRFFAPCEDIVTRMEAGCLQWPHG